MYLDDAIDIINERLEIIKRDDRVAICGMAEVFVRLMQYTNISTYNIDEYIDNSKFGRYFFGKLIKKPSEINWDKVNVVVIAALNNTSKSIKKELEENIKFVGKIITLEIPNSARQFYEHIVKSDVLVPQEYRSLIESNIRFKNKHRGERLFLLGNAPSIKEMDLKPLKNEHTMVVSNFYFHPDYDYINPEYYCFPQFTYTQLITKDKLTNWINEVFKNTNNPQFFFNISDILTINNCIGVNDKKIQYVDMDTRIKSEYFEDIDLTKKIMGVRSVPIMCIQIAIYMGFSEIYLLGIGHNNIIDKKYEYFFDSNKKVLNNLEDGLKNDIDTRPFKTVLPAACCLWDQYKCLKAIAEKNNIKIYNADKTSLLDVFERVTYKSIWEL